MKSSILRAGVVAAACALGLSACGGGSGDLVLSGAVSGVTADGLVLQNNGGSDLVVPAGATYFEFPNRISTDDQFNITVKSYPSNAETCVVNNGKARGNYWSIQQISVACSLKTHKLTVQIQGLNATSTGLAIVNGTDKKTVPAGATSIKMDDVFQGAAYGISVLTNPTGQTCTVSGGDTGTGTGVVKETDVNNVVVTCRP
jgi:hypothetical protein